MADNQQQEARDHPCAEQFPRPTWEELERYWRQRDEELQRIDDMLRREEKRLWPDSKPA